MSTGTLVQRGELVGHNGWVTCLATTSEDPDVLLSGSRDRTILVWQITRSEESYAFAHKSLQGHSHFVEDLAISSDGQFCLSASSDATLRLWNLTTGQTEKRFIGHTKDVLSVAFSFDNRQIVSGSRDCSIKLWNTLGECKFNMANAHSEWVSCVRFSPSTTHPLLVSCGWDKLVKVWNISTCQIRSTLVGHEGYLNTVTVSPDGSLCASGGKEGVACLWDLFEGKKLYTLKAEGGGIIHSLTFSPNRYWLCAATSKAIIVWDLETKQEVDKIELPAPVGKKAVPIHCLSLCWSADGSTLFAGFTDNKIRVFHVSN